MLQDSVHLIGNASVGNRALGERSLAWCRTLRARFTDCDDLLIEHEALALHGLGLHDESDALLVARIATAPDDPMPYAVLSDNLGWQRGDEPPRDLPRAIALLEEAKARPVRDADSWDIERRLESLREMQAET